MKIYKDKEVPAHTEKIIVKRICDLCGKEGKHSWDGGIFEESNTAIKASIRHKEGRNYPDSGFGDEIDIDLCPNCFRNKLVPWLQEQGANIKYEEWDW